MNHSETPVKPFLEGGGGGLNSEVEEELFPP